MDKDDPFRHGANPGNNQGNENDFDDDARYDDAVTPSVREEEYAAGQEEWDQPIDELAEDDQQLEAEPQPKRDPFAEEGPLEDDYAEHGQHADGDDNGEQNHEEDHDQEHDLEHDPEVDGPQQAAPGSASPLSGMQAPAGLMKQLPLIGGGIAALVIAFFGYQQFFASDASTPTTPSLENQNTWDLQPGHSSTPHASNEFQQPAPTPAQPDPAATNPAPSTAMITPVVAPVAEPAPQQQAPLPVAAAPNPLEGRIAELTAQLEQMKQTQDQLNQKLAAATAAPPSMDENSKAATQALNDRIAQLEQKLAAQPTPAPAPVSQAVDAPTKPSHTKATRTVDQDQPAPTTRKSKRGSTDFMAVKKSKAAKKRRVEPADDGFEPVASRPSFQGWILRSAQPGSAWLSQGPYSSDLRRVVPGDKVQGLGTVTSIHQIAGRWVVEGTQGAVR